MTANQAFFMTLLLAPVIHVSKAQVYKLCDSFANGCCLADASSTSGCNVGSLTLSVDDCNGAAMPSSFNGCVHYHDQWSEGWTYMNNGKGHDEWNYWPGGLCNNYGEAHEFNATLNSQPVTLQNSKPVVAPVIQVSGGQVYKLCDSSQNACCLADASSTSGCNVGSLTLSVDDCNGAPMPNSFTGCVHYHDQWSEGKTYMLNGKGHDEWNYWPGGLCSTYGEPHEFNASLNSQSMTLQNTKRVETTSSPGSIIM